MIALASFFFDSSNPLFLQSLLSVHDTVAQKSYDPELPPLPEDINNDEDSVKIIRLVKNKEPLVGNLFSHLDKFCKYKQKHIKQNT